MTALDAEAVDSHDVGVHTVVGPFAALQPQNYLIFFKNNGFYP